MIKKFHNFITEKNTYKDQLSDEYKDLKDELLDIIEEGNPDTKNPDVLRTTIEAYLKDKSSVTILSNNSDIYNFYLKFTSDIDDILFKDGFYKKSADSMSITGLYDYVVAGTTAAIEILMEKISTDLFNS